MEKKISERFTEDLRLSAAQKARLHKVVIREQAQKAQNIMRIANKAGVSGSNRGIART